MKYLDDATSEDRKFFFHSIPWMVDNYRGSDSFFTVKSDVDHEVKGYAHYGGHHGEIYSGVEMPEGGNIFLSALALHPTFFLGNTLRTLLIAPFTLMKCHRVTTLTPMSNKRALRINKHSGAEFEGILKDWFVYDDIIEDAVIFTLTKMRAKELGYW